MGTSQFDSWSQSYEHKFGLDYIKIDVAKLNFKMVYINFDVIKAKFIFIELTSGEVDKDAQMIKNLTKSVIWVCLNLAFNKLYLSQMG